MLADLLGKTVQFTDLPPEQARDQMIQYGMPGPLADAVIASMGSPRLGHGKTPLPTVEQVTGLRPRGFRDWADSAPGRLRHSRCELVAGVHRPSLTPRREAAPLPLPPLPTRTRSRSGPAASGCWTAGRTPTVKPKAG